MPDLTEQELRELDLEVARLAGVNVTVGFWTRRLVTTSGLPWRPHASFDQALEHLGPVLAKRGLIFKLLWMSATENFVQVFQDDELQLVDEHDGKTSALAFCLAVKAALTKEKDDGCNRKT